MMKASNRITSSFRPYVALWAMLALVGAVSCGAGHKSSRETDSNLSEQPRKELTDAMKAIAEGDAAKVASLCIYPIYRPYPLRDIADSSAMVLYFPILADENLRQIMHNGKVADWKEAGWRGWIFSDSALVSYEDGIYAIDYLSPSEIALRNLLSRQEIESLAPALRGNWQPVTCFLDTLTGTLFRIDRDDKKEIINATPWDYPEATSEGKPIVYRLAYYNSSTPLSGMPTGELEGGVRREGSMGIPIFSFINAKGDSCVYVSDPDSNDPNLMLRIGSDKRTIYAIPVYWRDYISPKR